MKYLYRISIYMAGLAILSFGSVLNTKTGYGVSPINSLPYVLAQLTDMSLGGMTTIVFVIYILIEIVIIGSKFKKRVLFQLPVSILFGQFTNFFNDTINYYPEMHVVRITLLIISILATAVGVVFILSVDLEPLAPDGLTNEISILIKRDFGFVKNIIDFTSVTLAIIVALIGTGALIGVGVGTIISAIMIGRCIAWLSPRIRLNYSCLEN